MKRKARNIYNDHKKTSISDDEWQHDAEFESKVISQTTPKRSWSYSGRRKDMLNDVETRQHYFTGNHAFREGFYDYIYCPDRKHKPILLWIPFNNQSNIQKTLRHYIKCLKQKVPKDIFEIIKSEMEQHRNNLRGIETQHKLSRKHINIFKDDGHCNSTFIAKLKIRKIVNNFQFQFCEPSKVKIHEIYCREMSTGYREQFDSLK